MMDIIHWGVDIYLQIIGFKCFVADKKVLLAIKTLIDDGKSLQEAEASVLMPGRGSRIKKTKRWLGDSEEEDEDHEEMPPAI